jgi:hypothetical protein
MFFGAFALVIFGRLVQLQIIEHPRYAKAAQNELAGDDTIYAHRGSILDRMAMSWRRVSTHGTFTSVRRVGRTPPWRHSHQPGWPKA